MAAGCRAKTGRAVCVVLTGTPAAPEFVWRGEVALVDPAWPEPLGPYHAVMDLPWHEAEVAVQPLVARIEAAARTAIESLLQQMAAIGGKVTTLGVVGSPDRSLAKLGNNHIRAHAAEGILFRRVLESAARHSRVPCQSFSEKQISQDAALRLGGDSKVAAHLKILGRQAGPPWRADERAAAKAAWLSSLT